MTLFEINNILKIDFSKVIESFEARGGAAKNATFNDVEDKIGVTVNGRKIE